MRHKNGWLRLPTGIACALLAATATAAPVNLVCTQELNNKTADRIQLVLDESAGTAGFSGYDKRWQAEFTNSTAKWATDGGDSNVSSHDEWELNRDNGFLTRKGTTFGARVMTPAYSSAIYRCEAAKRVF